MGSLASGRYSWVKHFPALPGVRIAKIRATKDPIAIICHLTGMALT
jgi:hypothetical protein